MCSNQEGDAEFQAKAEDLRGGRVCMKCDQAAVVIIRSNDAFCRDCFLQYCTHKFRSAFGKSKLVRDQEQVLVAYSGGASSCAMLHLIQEGLSRRAQKKLRFLPTLVFIDEGAALGLSSTDCEQFISSATEKMQNSGRPFHVFSLDEALKLQSTPPTAASSAAAAIPSAAAATPSAAEVTSAAADVAVQLEDKLKLKADSSVRLAETVGSAQTLSAKESLLFLLRQKALVKIARHLGIGKVLLGDNSTRLSIRMLSNITQGRGSHLSYEMNFSDDRHGDTILVRPMRGLSAKEVAVYNNLNNIESMVIPTLGTKVASNASIDKLTEEFVTGLQSNFPNTVSTIVRTGEKLELAEPGTVQEERCCLCQAPLDTNVGDCSALGATLFSQALCQPSQTSQDPSTNQNRCEQRAIGGDCCGKGDGSCNKAKLQRFSSQEFTSTLCYGCRLVVKDMSDFHALPSSVLDEAAQSQRRIQMKESINDYLLENNG